MDLEEPVKVSAQLCVGTVTRTALPAPSIHTAAGFTWPRASWGSAPLCRRSRKMRRSMFFSAPLMAPDRTPLMRALMPHDRTTLGARGSDLEARVARVELAVADVRVGQI